MQDKTSIIFTGDIGFDKYMDGKWEDSELISDEIIKYMNSANHVVANIEGPIIGADKIDTTSGVAQLMHSIDPKATNVLRNINADIWNICNNHIMDAGKEGLEATLKEASDFGAKTIGAGMNMDEAKRPLILDEAGGIGMFSVGYRRGCKPAGEDKAGCLNWNEMEIIKSNIDYIKSKCKWCVIVSHGGEEFTSLPSPYTRDRYLKFLDMGADIVVSHHPHVPMNYELVGEKAIFYSLGNFIFDTDYQRAQFNTEKGIILKIDFTKDSFNFEAVGIKIDREKEHIVKNDLPRIFRNVGQSDYEKLAPLAAKMFISATKRQQIYLNKEKFLNATDRDWEEHFANPKRSGRVEGEALDFFVICPLAKKEEEKAWMESGLEDVKEYILEQM